MTTLRPYLRVSQDRSGREKSPEQQLSDLTGDAEVQRWRVHPGAYRDVGSASRYATRARVGFDRLIADLRAGRFHAEVLGLWESSRGSRRVGEWATLLDLLEDNNVRVWVHTHGRLYDPRNGRDRRTLLEDAVDSEYESSKTSERIRRDTAALAAEGRPTGKIPYGYERVYAIENGRRVLVEQRPHPVEAEHIRELFRRILAGHAMRTIARDWEARGIRSRSGRVFTQSRLRSMALNPTYAGLRVHAPGVTGWRRLGSGTTTPAVWPALVSEADFLTVQRLLTDPQRMTWRPGGARHWLSLIAVCDPCRRFLTVATKEGREKYRCQRGCVQVPKDQLEGWVERVLLRYLSRPDVYRSMVARDVRREEEIERLDVELARLRLELAEAERSEPESVHEARMIGKLVHRLETEISDLEFRRGELVVPPELRGLVSPGVDVKDRWGQADIATRRAVAKLLFTPEGVGELRVMRAEVKGPFQPHVSTRVRWVRVPESEAEVTATASKS